MKNGSEVLRWSQAGWVSLLAVFAVQLLDRAAVVGQELNPEIRREIDFNPTEVFNEVVTHVDEHFFDINDDLVQVRESAAAMRKWVAQAKTQAEFDSQVNLWLAGLKTSHTFYFSKHNPKRFQLVGVFDAVYGDQPDSFFRYPGIGIDTFTGIKGGVFVQSVYEGFSAHEAGLRFGDQILSVDGQPFRSILSFQGKVGQQVAIEIFRDGKRKMIDIQVVEIDGRTMFERAFESSVRVINHKGKRIGYAHMWSYAGTKYQQALRKEILWGRLHDCDSLVLDLRDGWGGADVNYLNMFRKPIVEIESRSRTSPGGNYTGVWGKPVALLTNNRSTSGKELFTFGFKKLKLGKVFGETTAGAVVAGRSFLLSNGDVLYLAVADVKVDGTRLEGVGVKPDVEVTRPLADGGEQDPQLNAALDYLAGLLKPAANHGG